MALVIFWCLHGLPTSEKFKTRKVPAGICIYVPVIDKAGYKALFTCVMTMEHQMNAFCNHAG